MILSELFSTLPVFRIKGNANLEVQGIAFDSREVRPGYLFVCLSGLVQDGHIFAQDAIRRGAIAILGERVVSVPSHISLIVVPDSRAALATIAARFYAYPTQKLKLIGVTGTNGKTTTVQLLNRMFNESGQRSGCIGTLGMNVGSYREKTSNTTPESLDLQRLLHIMVENAANYAIMEVSSHALDMGRVRECHFHTGVFTNLTHDHLDYHKSFKDYREAKKMLFTALPPSLPTQQSYAVLNADDPTSATYARATKASVLTYGTSQSANVQAEDIVVTPKATTFTVKAFGFTFHVQWAVPGLHNVYNALAAICTGIVHDIPIPSMVTTLRNFHGVEGRVETLESRNGVTAIIDYAHTPDALRNILRTAHQLSRGRVYCVFGCEGDRDRLKRPLMANIALEMSDFPVLTLDNTRMEEPNSIFDDMTSDYKRWNVPASAYSQIPDRREAICYALDCARPGDCVVIAGKGHETVQILGSTEVHFQDKQVVMDFWGRHGFDLHG